MNESLENAAGTAAPAVRAAESRRNTRSDGLNPKNEKNVRFPVPYPRHAIESAAMIPFSSAHVERAEKTRTPDLSLSGMLLPPSAPMTFCCAEISLA